MSNIAIFASGSGTNAENIIKYFSTKKHAKVTLVLSNKRHAKVLERAERLGVETLFFEREDFYNSDKILQYLKTKRIDFIVLAGFLWLVPVCITKYYKQRIVNIHPALLPSHGGKGMYGEAVHRAVIDNHDKESGITIHYVNDHYDKGDIIFQARCSIETDDDHESLAGKIHMLEYEYFPQIIDELVSRLPESGK